MSTSKEYINKYMRNYRKRKKEELEQLQINYEDLKSEILLNLHKIELFEQNKATIIQLEAENACLKAELEDIKHETENKS